MALVGAAEFIAIATACSDQGDTESLLRKHNRNRRAYGGGDMSAGSERIERPATRGAKSMDRPRYGANVGYINKTSGALFRIQPIDYPDTCDRQRRAPSSTFYPSSIDASGRT